MSRKLVVESLSVVLGDKPILESISFTLKQGEILGLVGPSGCGKTTLLNALAGFIDCSSGEIRLLDQQVISARTPLAPEARNIGVIFQDYALFPHLSVNENIAFGIQQLPKAEKQEKIAKVLSLLHLEDFSHRYPHELSGGQQQRVAIARALVREPQLLLLDEPFSNIDARLRNELMFELRKLLKEIGITAIFVTHNKDEVFTFADHMALLHQGHIAQMGTPAEVFNHPNSWHVADFLQIGSWLPITSEEQGWQSALGTIEALDSAEGNVQLLVKPDLLELTNGVPNCQVEHISFTERGYHYLLSSLNEASPLSFHQLSFYSQQCLTIGQKVAIHLIPHSYQVFAIE